MDDKRKVQRHRVLKAGRITFGHAGSIDCTVRNLSAAGACLNVESPLDIPDYFTLVVESDNLKRSSHVIWRAATRIGIEFRD